MFFRLQVKSSTSLSVTEPWYIPAASPHRSLICELVLGSDIKYGNTAKCNTSTFPLTPAVRTFLFLSTAPSSLSKDLGIHLTRLSRSHKYIWLGQPQDTVQPASSTAQSRTPTQTMCSFTPFSDTQGFTNHGISFQKPALNGKYSLKQLLRR